MTPPKSIFRSKVFWFNIISGAALIGQHVANLHILPPGIAETVLVVTNVLLRFFTNQPIKEVQAKG